MTDRSELEAPSVFTGSNYHGIEYFNDHHCECFMRSCGFQRCLPDYAYPHNAREGYHLHAVLSGKGLLRVRGQEYSIHEGQLFLLKDREEAFYQADREDPWFYAWVNYGGELAGTFLQHAGFTEGVYVLPCHVDIMGFLTIVKEILKHQQLNVSSELYRMSLAFQFLSLAMESWENSSNTQHMRPGLTTEDYVDYAVRYIDGNFATAKISEVASYIGINRTYLTSIFKKKMLMSPQEYLMQVKMNHSRDLLLKTNLPIQVVSREVGYEDQLTFSRIFRKKYGLSPEQYRKKYAKS